MTQANQDTNATRHVVERPTRADRAPWDPSYAERHELFGPLSRLAGAFASCSDWPSVADWDRAFAAGSWASAAGVRFVPAAPRARRKRSRSVGCNPDELYDARIARGEVPSRERSWHDFLNAHVWAAFPASKRALHQRQHRMMSERLRPFAGAQGRPRLPSHRTPEQDAIAMVDEGSALLLVPTTESETLIRALAERTHESVWDCVRRGAVDLLVFGHGAYEVMTVAPRPLELMTIVLEVDALAESLDLRLEAADRLLAARLQSRTQFKAPGEHPTLRIGG